MVSHRNILANLLQITSNESQWRSSLQAASGKPTYSEVILDTLPQSHIYGLVYICLLAFFRGDEVVVLPRFDFAEMLRAIQQRRIETLPLVPPIIASIAKSADELAAYDLSSVKYIITGAAPLGAETASLLHSVYPSWVIRQGYGEFCSLAFSKHLLMSYIRSDGDSNGGIFFNASRYMVWVKWDADPWFRSATGR